MVNVKNVKIVDLPFESDDKNFQRCVEYIKLIDPDYKKYFPTKSKQKLSFELVDANVDLANTVRRFLIDEIPILSMDVDINDIKTDDKFILQDYFKKNIELIPINQDLSYDKLTISLQLVNNSDNNIPVYAKYISIKDAKGKQLKTSDYFSNTIIIYNLRPMCEININKINIVSGLGKHDSGKFIPLANISYEILDVKPVVQVKYNVSGKSSLNSNPTQFSISMTNHRNTSTKKIMITCCTLIINKFNTIYKELEEIKDTSVYFSTTMNIETKEDIKIFHFIGEYWTIANILSRYCYIIDNEISFVCASIIHPSIEESMVKIKHQQPKKILMSAIKKIINDITVIKNAF
jgi:DNA-directed RNA polymerase subunit L